MRRLRRLSGVYSVFRFEPDTKLPKWIEGSSFSSVTRTPSELSIITQTPAFPVDVPAEHGFAALELEGPINFSEVGILASMSEALSEAGISLLAISTFDTDILLIKEHHLPDAVAALNLAGFELSS